MALLPAKSALTHLHKLKTLSVTHIDYAQYASALSDIEPRFEQDILEVPASHPSKRRLQNAMNAFVEVRNYWKHSLQHSLGKTYVWTFPDLEKPANEHFVQWMDKRVADDPNLKTLRAIGGIPKIGQLPNVGMIAVNALWVFAANETEEAAKLLSLND